MGPRPADFDEPVIRQSPTFIRWMQLAVGEKMKYACREFIKGHAEDEERLMRRIMIARRNNLKDHQTLKRARQTTGHHQEPEQEQQQQLEQQLEQQQHKTFQDNGDHHVQQDSLDEKPPAAKVAKLDPPQGDKAEVATTSDTTPPESKSPTSPSSPSSNTGTIPTSAAPRKRRPASLFSDAHVAKEMDVAAVEATRSYRAWLELPEGAEFVYNQKYVKGKEGHDWLLRKNIWRRMRYRRENKKMVERMKEVESHSTAAPAFESHTNTPSSAAVAVPASSQSRSSLHEQQPYLSDGAASVASQIVDQTLLPNHPSLPSTKANTIATRNQDTTRTPPSVALINGTSIGATNNLSMEEDQFADPLPTTTTTGTCEHHTDHDAFQVETAAVEAAVAVAESYAKSPYTSTTMVHNPLESSAAHSAALDAAARLAAAAAASSSGTVLSEEQEDEDENENENPGAVNDTLVVAPIASGTPGDQQSIKSEGDDDKQIMRRENGEVLTA